MSGLSCALYCSLWEASSALGCILCHLCYTSLSSHEVPGQCPCAPNSPGSTDVTYLLLKATFMQSRILFRNCQEVGTLLSAVPLPACRVVAFRSLRAVWANWCRLDVILANIVGIFRVLSEGASFISRKKEISDVMSNMADRLCGLVVRVPGYRSRGPGSIPGSTKFS
jgi:hypothetical protein